MLKRCGLAAALRTETHTCEWMRKAFGPAPGWAVTDSSSWRSRVPKRTHQTQTFGGTGLELITSHNEALIPRLGPLGTVSLGLNSKQSRGADLKLIHPPALSVSPSSLPALLLWIRDTESLGRDPLDHVRAEGRLAIGPAGGALFSR